MSESRVKRTLLIVPHMDDESISCGGLIQNRLRTGGEVHVRAVFDRRYGYVDPRASRETSDRHVLAMRDEFDDYMAALHLLGAHPMLVNAWFKPEGVPGAVGYYPILESVELALAGVRPTEVVIPADDDLNQDHRHLAHVMAIALRPTNLGDVERVLEFFALDGQIRQPTWYEPLTEDLLSVKLSAIAKYRRESRGGDSPRAPDVVTAQARVWGAASGQRYAEAYRLRFARSACGLPSPGGQGSSAPT